MTQARHYIGVMSGSSLDGIDVALTNIDADNCQVVATHFSAYPSALKQALLDLHSPTDNEIEKAAIIGNQLAEAYAQAVHTLLEENQQQPAHIAAIGCHGQTIRHRPVINDDIGYTIQLGNNALLAERTGISVVGDFRSRDIAAGGQGAPLVPAFHQAVFSSAEQNRAIINIGGIANITYLSKTESVKPNTVLGFDSGPGNMLMDYWVKLHLGQDYDADGTWAATGTIQPALLNAMLADPYFALPAPKSTGRDLFNKAWLHAHLKDCTAAPEDIAHTLVALTSQSIAQAMTQYCPDVDAVYLCGGGVHNQLLCESLQAALGQTPVATTTALGIDADWVEAAAFAWLAKQAMHQQTGNLPTATGAAGQRILGAIYPN